MAEPGDAFDLPELSRASGVSPRTIRYYIQQGLLPSPGARGPGARYDRGHLDRIQLIRRLQKEHLPLAEIRLRLEQMDDATVRTALGAPEPKAHSTTLEYVRQLLAGGGPAAREQRSQWERVTLAPDVELHVRRPLSRAQNSLVERLIELARRAREENGSAKR